MNKKEFMMKKNLFLALIMLVGLFATTSCEKEAEPIAPVLGEITFDKNPCYPGDTVKATVTYAKAGKYFTFSKRLSSFKNLPAEKIIDEYAGVSTIEPFVRFIVKDEPNTYIVSYSGQLEWLAGQNLWGEVLNTKGTLVVLGEE